MPLLSVLGCTDVQYQCRTVIIHFVTGRKYFFLFILQYGINFVISAVKFYDFIFDIDVETEKKFYIKIVFFVFVPCVNAD